VTPWERRSTWTFIVGSLFCIAALLYMARLRLQWTDYFLPLHGFNVGMMVAALRLR
jgi:hypothetical protein